MAISLRSGLGRFSKWRRSGWKGIVSSLVVLAAIVWLIGGRATREAANGSGAIAAILEAPAVSAAPEIEGDDAKTRCLQILEQAEARLANADCMTAVFHKRERIDGDLQELNVMDVKVRREPLNVHMQWRTPNKGRELIWRADANDQMILLHAGGFAGKLMPLLRLDPEGDRAKETSKRPISNMGIWNFNKRLLELVRDELTVERIGCELNEEVKLDGRAALLFTYTDPAAITDDANYRVQIYVDRELETPVGCEVFRRASAADAPVLEESYVFNELNLTAQLNEIDFDAANPAYKFIKR